MAAPAKSSEVRMFSRRTARATPCLPTCKRARVHVRQQQQWHALASAEALPVALSPAAAPSSHTQGRGAVQACASCQHINATTNNKRTHHPGTFLFEVTIIIAHRVESVTTDLPNRPPSVIAEATDSNIRSTQLHIAFRYDSNSRKFSFDVVT